MIGMTLLEAMFGPSAAYRAFAHRQLLRGRIRMILLLRGLRAATFWTVAILLLAWLVELGLSVVALALLAVWTLLMAPAVYIQTMLMVDLLTVKTLRRVWMYPRFVSTIIKRIVYSELLAPHGVVEKKPSFLRRVSDFAGVTSPIDPLATWAFLVLLRIPALTQFAMEEEARTRKWAEAFIRRAQKKELKRQLKKELARFGRAPALYTSTIRKNPQAKEFIRSGRVAVKSPPRQSRAARTHVLKEILAAI